MGFEKYIMPYVQHYSIVRRVSLFHLFNPAPAILPAILIFYFLSSFAFSRMSHKGIIQYVAISDWLLLLIERILGCFQFLLIQKKAAIMICMHVFV